MSGSPEVAAPVAEPQVTSTSTEDVKPQVQVEETKTEEATAPAETELAKDSEDWPEGTPEWAKKEISKLRTKARRASTRAERAQADLERERFVKSQERDNKPEPARDEPKAPKLADFGTYEEYERADRAFIAEQTRKATLKELDDRDKASKAKADQESEAKRFKQARDRFETASDSVAEHYEDFDDVMERMWAGKIPVIAQHDHVAEYIIEVSDRGPELAYHLDANPKEAERIASLPRLAQVRELARLEASLPKPGAKNVTKAPPPPKQVGARGGSDGKDPEKMTIEEMRAATKTVKRVPD